MKRFSEIPRLKLTAGEGFCEDLSCQKARVGEGREHERKELPPLSNFIHKKLQSAESLGSSLALQCYAAFYVALVSSGFL